MISQQHHAFCAPQVASPPLSQDQIQHVPPPAKPTTTIYPTIANIVSSSSSLSLHSAKSSASPLPSALPSPASEYESSPSHESFWSQSPEPEPEPEQDEIHESTAPWWQDQPQYRDRTGEISDACRRSSLDRRFNRPPSYPGATVSSSKNVNAVMAEGAYRIEELNDVEDAAPLDFGLRERAWTYSYPPPSTTTTPHRSYSTSPRSFEPYPRLPPIAPKGTNANGGSSAPSSLPSASTLHLAPSDLPPSLQYRRSSASSTTTTSSSCSSTSSFVGPVKSYLKASRARQRKVVLPPYFDRMSDAQKRLYECHPPSPIHSDDGDDSDSSLSDAEGSCSSVPSSAPGSPILHHQRLDGFATSFSGPQDQENDRENNQKHDYSFGSAPPPLPPRHATLAPRPSLFVSPHSSSSGSYHPEGGQYPGMGEGHHHHPQQHHHQGYLYRSSSTGSTYSSSGSTPSPATARSSSSTFYGPPPLTTANALPHPTTATMKPRRRVRASPSNGFMALSSPELLNGGPGTVTAPDGTKIIKNKDGSIMVYNPQTDSVTFRCELCPGESFGRIHDLKRHQTSKHQEMTWPCDFCHRPFVRRDALLRHYTVKAARDDGLHPAAHEVDKLMAARARAKMLC